MKSKVFVVTIIASFAIFFSSVNAFARNKVGYINIQRIVSESKMGKKAQAEIKKIREKRVFEIKRKRKSIADLSNQIVKIQKRNPKELKIGRLVEELQQKNKEFKRFGADVKEELAKKDRQLVFKILQEADPIVKKIAKKKGYSLILKNASDLAFLDPDVDLTDEIIKGLNR